MTTSAHAPRRPIPVRGTDDDWITVQQAADHLGVHHETIYDACRRRALRHAKIVRGAIRLRRAWVDAWAESLAEPVKTGKK